MRYTRLKSFTPATGVALLLLAGCRSAGNVALRSTDGPSYRAIVLEPFEGVASYPRGIDEYGRVFGRSDAPGGAIHAFVYNSALIAGTQEYQPIAMWDLGAIDGGNSAAAAINSHGCVVGWATLPGGVCRAFLSSCSFGLRMLDPGTPQGFTRSVACGINRLGEIVGYVESPDGAWSRAFTYCKGHFTKPGTLGGGSGRAYAVNDGGQVVGESSLRGGASHAFLFVSRQIVDLGTLKGTNSGATCVNTRGDVAGWAETRGGSRHAFVYRAGRMKDLGTLGGRTSIAWGINNRGEVVGSAEDPGGQKRAFV